MRSSPAILLVEDNPDDVDLTLRALRQNQVKNEVVVARSGEEALDYLFARGSYKDRDTALPQIILLDLNLPRTDGLEVLRQIRGDQRTRLLPVVVLTSSKEESDLAESYGKGCNSYVQKPVDFKHFAETAKQLSRYWLDLNEPPPAARTV